MKDGNSQGQQMEPDEYAALVLSNAVDLAENVPAKYRADAFRWACGFLSCQNQAAMMAAGASAVQKAMLDQANAERQAAQLFGINGRTK